MLVLILFGGFAPFLLNGFGHGLSIIGNCAISADSSICDWALWLQFLIILGFGSIPVMFVALAVWAVAKSVLCRPRITQLESEAK